MNDKEMTTFNQRNEYVKSILPEDVYETLSGKWDEFCDSCFHSVSNLIEDNFDEEGVIEDNDGETFEIKEVVQHLFETFLFRIRMDGEDLEKTEIEMKDILQKIREK